MAIVDFALEHARQGRLVFPGVPNSKLPAIKNPYEAATTNEAQIIEWWQENPNYNICLPGGYEIVPGKYLGFIDVDLKDDRNGFETMSQLAIIGCEFPKTLAQGTPTNGLHLFYFFDFPIKNGVNSLGKGIDIRGFHGYIIGAGSGIYGKSYVFKNRLQIAQAPEWVAIRCQRPGSVRGPDGITREPNPDERRLSVVHDVDESVAAGRATQFLNHQETIREGERNRKGFETACRLKDFGVSRSRTFELMSAHWKCEPILEPDELWQVINSAFKYGQNAPAIDAPENAFDPIPPTVDKKPKHPIDQINDEFALVVAGGGVRILWETKTQKDKDRVEHLSIPDFHVLQANNEIIVKEKDTNKEKRIPVSKMWIKSKARRQYDGIIFDPTYKGKDFFNVWRGFMVNPEDKTPHPKAVRALDLLLEHILKNVCHGEIDHSNWILAFFAHLIQFPETKPRVALALRGKKGVGKNVITECLKLLLGQHYMLASHGRFVFGNFNSHMENKLLLVLDEAFWSGNKQSEGILKDLITGSTQQIERKGHEPYTVANLMRIVIFGNEDWIVPASDDERRFAVFEVGEGRRRDDAFFGEILDGMRNFGGDRLLLKYLLEFDLTKANINKAPDTDALMAQKAQTLEPFKAWWLSCLTAGYIIGSGDEWPETIGREAFRDAFTRECERQKIGGRFPSPIRIGKMFKEIAPTSSNEHFKRDGENLFRAYKLASLDVARQEWEKFIGGPVKWPERN